MAGIPRNERNNFGFLRLLFAALVLVSHSSELVDGNRSREILSQIFGTLSFGEAAVLGFFIVSGYLISQSFASNQKGKVTEYFRNRLLRIYPGFIVASAISMILAAVLTSVGDVPGIAWFAGSLQKLLLLEQPEYPGAFLGLPNESIDGPLYTIAYEFRCYIFVGVVGLLGAYKGTWGKSAFLALFILLLALTLKPTWRPVPATFDPFLGQSGLTVRFTCAFMMGVVYYSFKDRISLNRRLAALATACLTCLMFSERLAFPAFIAFGGYLIFWVAFCIKPSRWTLSGLRDDYSYGLYLYAWPVQNLTIWYWRDISPWLLLVWTLGIGLAAAYLSWRFVERPFLRIKSRRPPPAIGPSLA